MRFHTDCRFWRGDKPCPENRLCEGCGAYRPLGPRILIIKLGARGDVLRTTPLATGLKQRQPDAHLTWLTAPESVELLTGLPEVDQVKPFGPEAALELAARSFDLLVCLDKEPWATGLAETIRAKRKTGWGMAPDGTGTPRAFTPEADYALALGVSDELKFRKNQKTYPELIYEMTGLTYAGEPYLFRLADRDRDARNRFFEDQRIPAGTPVLGLVTGCGAAYPRKRWTEEGFAVLARQAQRELGAAVLLLAGPDEQDINARIRGLAQAPVYDTRGRHTLREFAGFLEACRVVVTGDTLALHLALALRKPTVALFGPTAPQEIEMFGLGPKLVTPAACAPCYRGACDQDPDCMQAISVPDVWAAVRERWEAPA